MNTARLNLAVDVTDTDAIRQVVASGGAEKPTLETIRQ